MSVEAPRVLYFSISIFLLCHYCWICFNFQDKFFSEDLKLIQKINHQSRLVFLAKHL